jgi:hypothetical protein
MRLLGQKASEEFFNETNVDISEDEWMDFDLWEQQQQQYKITTSSLIYVSPEIMKELGYNATLWEEKIQESLTNDINSQVITISNDMKQALSIIKKGFMTTDDLVICLTKPSYIQNIGVWVDHYISTHKVLQEDFVTGLFAYIKSMGFSDVYVRTTIMEMMERLQK